MAMFDWIRKMRTNVPDNLLAKVLYQSIGNDQVVWSDADMVTMVETHHNSNADLFSVIDFLTNGFNKIDLVVKRGTKEDFKIITEGPLYELINNPNPSQSQDEFFALGLKFKLVTGNWYIYGPRRYKDGPMIEMWNLPSQYTTIVSGGWTMPVKGYNLILNGGSQKKFTPEDVLHIREPNLDFGSGRELYGMSRLKPGNTTVDINQYAQEATASRFKNRGMAGFLTILGLDAKDGIKVSQDIKAQIRKQGKGSANEGSIVATGYDMKFTPTMIPAVDLGIFDGQKRTLHQMCNLYHLPAILMDPTVANTYNNIREAQKDGYRNAIIPEVQQFCTDFNRWIADTYKGEWLDFDTSGVECLQADNQAMATWLSLAWWLTPNQKLDIQGYEQSTDPEMDKIYIPAGNIPLIDQAIPDLIKNMKGY